MDRPTTGRRHVRAGSVHVTELINKRVLRSEAPASPAARTALATRPDPEFGAVVHVLEPVEPAPDPPAPRWRPPSRGAQFAKLAGLGAATLVLCAAVAVAATISRQRADQQAADPPTMRITGDQALLPDRLDRTLPTTAAPVPPAQEAPRRPAPPEPHRPQPPAAAPNEAAPVVEASVEPAAEPIDDTISDVALVERFYDLLPSDPDSAFALIAPGLLSATLGEFLDSWSTVTGIDVVDVRERAGGVLAVVRMDLADGGHLRIEQLLTVADSPRRITGVQLLSAQRN